jgi:hypothetical protein
MVSLKDRNAFWGAVEDCLVEFHGLSRHDAKKKSKDLRKRIESPPKGISSNILYHDEPFDVACDIAGTPLNLSQYRQQYEGILSNHNW